MSLSTPQVRALKNLTQFNFENRGLVMPFGPQRIPYDKLLTLGLIEKRAPGLLWITEAGSLELSKVLGNGSGEKR